MTKDRIHPNNRRLRRALFWSVYSVVAIIALILLMEGVLTAGYYITKHRWLSTYSLPHTAPLPDHPEEYIKIAVFGGSSAEGFGVHTNFSRILEFELAKKYPGLRFFVTNDAESGWPFHGQQAELVKAQLDRYDILLIYAGHNEALPYLVLEIGYFTPPGFKAPKPKDPLVTKGLKFDLDLWLRVHSRVVAIARKVNQKYVNPPVDSGNVQATYAHIERPREFENKRIVPPDVMANINRNFERDLGEIASLAEEKGKTVVVSSVASSEEYPPFFSVHKDGMTDEELETFDLAYRRGMDAYREARFNEAESNFLAASQIDGDASILSFMLGRTYLELGRAEQGHDLVSKSRDGDGLTLRAPSSLNRIAEAVAKEFDSLHFVDSAQGFRRALDAGMNTEELFLDVIHPSLTGHAIIAQTFLTKLAELPPLNGHTSQEPFLDFPFSNPGPLISQYEAQFPAPAGFGHWALFSNAQYNFSYAKLSAHPEVYLDRSISFINDWYSSSEQTAPYQALRLLFLAMIEASRPDAQKAVALANDAIRADPTAVREYLNGSIFLEGKDQNGTWMNAEFRHYGLVYSADATSFTLLGGAEPAIQRGRGD